VYPIAKRLFDLVVSFTGLVILSPVILLIALWIRRDSPGPVLYRGVRAGQGGQPFHMLKFRTMVINADKIGGPSTSDDDPRVTRLGRRLRRFKLDEVPQLLNVLAGQMSFVGPRPEVLSEVAKYSPQERALVSVPPGITDWASIRFNNEGEILKGAADPHEAYLRLIRPEKVRLGLEYVQKRSLMVDLGILWETFTTILGTRSGRS
jgi:lipopolysaccharide/colanic/teichoic acid biosynthesis glycosyltransferase